MNRYHFTRQSANKKTGPIAVTMTDETSCPGSCPLRKVCYAVSGPVRMHWRALNDPSLPTSRAKPIGLTELCQHIRELPEGSFWRHNAAGDLPGVGERIDHAALAQIVNANRGRRGFTFTNKPLHLRNAQAVYASNKSGFTINISCVTVGQAEQVLSEGIGPVALTVPSDSDWPTRTPAGHPVYRCPATLSPLFKCIDCGFCADARPDRAIVAFPAHGTFTRETNRILRMLPHGPRVPDWHSPCRATP